MKLQSLAALHILSPEILPPKTSDKNLESESTLQAVILADSFNERFRPIAYEYDFSCLLSLCNTPLIEYTLELLAVAGVQEAYLFYREHSETIKDYIKKSKWSRSYSPIKIITIVTPEARSVGDALRKLDLKKQVHFTGQGESPIFVLDWKTNECFHCETVELYPRKRRTAIVRLMIEIIQKNVTQVTLQLNYGSTDHHLGAQLVGNHG
ncbi:21226_t:CDS:2 [Cetraspora pellucida]|uniref:21226_t:CDS:1 n=1 Tax=Cetraspora pellucida TaxID=1433469 RepID=A0A9N8WND9_9GLOM|nr:21226_t:CDS:2 [Cetraspora pellucida]